MVVRRLTTTTGLCLAMLTALLWHEAAAPKDRAALIQHFMRSLVGR